MHRGAFPTNGTGTWEKHYRLNGKEMQNAEKEAGTGVRWAEESNHQISASANQLLVGDGLHKASAERGPL
jgi:hypothetical protein